MESLLNSLKESWNKLSPRTRIVGGVISLIVFFSIIIFALFSSSDYHLLYTNLDLNDAAAVVDVLRENGISYKLNDNGSSILVPADLVYETRLTLASQGLPQGGVVGFETFETTRLGETEADRQLRYRIALEGELIRTIRGIQEVEDARVHLVIPTRSIFINESQPSKASVLLTLKPGVVLSNQQVRGITHLLATSVERLSPENITIVDNRGNVLSDFMNTADLDGNIVSQRFELETAFEKQLAADVTAMLERIYGYGKVVTLVNVELNFDTIEQYNELFTAPQRDTGLVRSQQSYSEVYLDSTAAAQGVAGAQSNIPGYVELESQDSPAFSKQESIINYELNRTEIHRSTPPGSIKNLSVSVWINGELPQVEIENIETSVINSLGMKLERGDLISVNSVPFETDFRLISADEFIKDTLSYKWIYLTLIVLSALLLITIVIRRVLKRKYQPQVAASVDYIDEHAEDKRLSPEEKAKLDTITRLRQYVNEKPKEFAQMLRSWLMDE